MIHETETQKKLRLFLTEMSLDQIAVAMRRFQHPKPQQKNDALAESAIPKAST